MLLLIRKIKRHLFANKQFRNYLLYALGELVLVVIGILIALQINNWNSDKQQREKLRNYLEIIAKNISSDVEVVYTIRAERQRSYEASVRWLNLSDRDGTLSVPEVAFAGRAYTLASELQHFHANTSGYEALKSSGMLNQMEGSDIESLLYDYYDTVSRIMLEERDYNEHVRQLWLQVLANWPPEFGAWEFVSPEVLTEERFQSLEPVCQELLSGTSMATLLGTPQSATPLLIEYEKLDHLGSVFRQMVEANVMDFGRSDRRILERIYDPGSGIGDPTVITGGQVSWHSCYLINSDANDSRISYEASNANQTSPFGVNSFIRNGDHLHVDYQGGVEWAGIWFASGALGSNLPRDYSRFEKLVLELKGDIDGETIYLNIKDRDDPSDGTTTKVPLVLTDQWKTYEINLSDFETADLETLLIPLGFVFYEEPVSFSVRTVKYIKPD